MLDNVVLKKHMFSPQGCPIRGIIIRKGIFTQLQVHYQSYQSSGSLHRERQHVQRNFICIGL